MVDFLRDFIKVLRLSDVRVSSSETIDAMHAASLVGIEDKEMLKVCLSQSLATSLREKEIFQECYENFFKEDYMNFVGRSRFTILECQRDIKYIMSCFAFSQATNTGLKKRFQQLELR